MKRQREQQEEAVSLALSLSTTTDSSTTSDSATAPPAAKRARRRGPLVATSGEGEFVCRTCNRAFTSFQALGGHRTSHLRGRHGLELGVGARALRQHKADAGVKQGAGGGDVKRQQHECHICGLGFEMGAAEAADAWVWRSVARLPEELLEVRSRAAAADTPVLLELFA